MDEVAETAFNLRQMRGRVAVLGGEDDGQFQVVRSLHLLVHVPGLHTLKVKDCSNGEIYSCVEMDI